MEFYYMVYTTYNKGNIVGTRYEKMLKREIPEDREYHINWDNAGDIYMNEGCMLPFNIYSFKKGRVVSFFDTHLLIRSYERDIKEWKQPLDITVRIEYRKINPSIDEVLSWHNGADAIEYLKEKGLAVCPMKM